MKTIKRTVFFLAALLLTFSMKGYSKDLYCDPSVEARMGYFFFTDSKMNEVFNQGGLDVQLCGSYPLWKCFQLYGSLEYLQKKGHSLGANEGTELWKLPVNLGIRSLMPVCSWANYYLTIGPRYFFMHVHNYSDFVRRKICENGIGGFLGTGFTFQPRCNLILDLFGEYSYERVHAHTNDVNVFTRNIQVGGLTFGAGLGYLF